METNNKESKEPFTPENTPQPPQVMDVRNKPERDEKQSDKSNSTVPKGDAGKRPENDQPGEKRLGESPIEIDDESTI